MISLRRWSLLGGGAVLTAGIALTGLLLTRFDRTAADAAGAARQDTAIEGRVTAVETWQTRHDDATRPLIERFERLDRRFDALFVWLRLVARQEGWPEPPLPAAAQPGACPPGETCETPEGILAGTMP